jgi:hypothetical protein
VFVKGFRDSPEADFFGFWIAAKAEALNFKPKPRTYYDYF